MTEQDRNEHGKFLAKGEVTRAVRSIRLTDSAWETLGDRADEQDMSRADYLEALTAGEVQWESNSDHSNQADLDFDLDEVAEVLKEAITLRANAGVKSKPKSGKLWRYWDLTRWKTNRVIRG